MSVTGSASDNRVSQIITCVIRGEVYLKMEYDFGKVNEAQKEAGKIKVENSKKNKVYSFYQAELEKSCKKKDEFNVYCESDDSNFMLKTGFGGHKFDVEDIKKLLEGDYILWQDKKGSFIALEIKPNWIILPKKQTDEIKKEILEIKNSENRTNVRKALDTEDCNGIIDQESSIWRNVPETMRLRAPKGFASWIRFYEANFSQNDVSKRTCKNIDCEYKGRYGINNIIGGAHVFPDGKAVTNHCYIVPLCNHCNLSETSNMDERTRKKIRLALDTEIVRVPYKPKMQSEDVSTSTNTMRNEAILDLDYHNKLSSYDLSPIGRKADSGCRQMVDKVNCNIKLKKKRIVKSRKGRKRRKSVIVKNKLYK